VRKVNRIAKVIKLFFKKADDFLIVAQAAGSNVKDNMDITKKSAKISNIYMMVRNKFTTSIVVFGVRSVVCGKEGVYNQRVPPHHQVSAQRQFLVEVEVDLRIFVLVR